MTDIVRLHNESKFAKLYEGVTSLGKRVAIKAYRSSVRDNARLRDRLYAAVSDAAAHPHDHLLDYIDIDREQGWVVSEWMHGSIHDLCRNDRPVAPNGTDILPPDVAITCLQQALSALKYLNDVGRFHGNLKPNNLLTDNTGKIYLSDPFMLAVDTPGVIPSVGTPKYLAPEMTGTLPTTPGPGMDLYALGISLIELLSGKRFTESMTGINQTTSENDMAFLRWHGDLEAKLPPVSEMVPGCRGDLCQVLDRMTVKDPHNRYRFASQVLQDLAVFSATSSTGAREAVAAGQRSTGNEGGVNPPGNQPQSSASQPSKPSPLATKRASERGNSSASDVMDRPDENVVVAIASGIRAGEMIGLDSHRFDVGFDHTCTITLERESENAPPETRVQVSQSSSGWTVEQLSGSGAFINQSLIHSAVPLRSGDLIRLSYAGPDIQFFLQSGLPSIKRLALDYLPAKPKPKIATKKSPVSQTGRAAGAPRRRSPNAPAARPTAPISSAPVSPAPVSPAPNSPAPNSPAPIAPAPQASAPKPFGGAAPLPPNPAPIPNAASIPAASGATGDGDWMRQTRVLDDGQPAAPSPLAPARPNLHASTPNAPGPSAPLAPSGHPSQPAAPSSLSTILPKGPLSFGSTPQPNGPAPTDGVVWTQPKTWDKKTKDRVLIGGAIVVAILAVILVPTGNSESETNAAPETTSVAADNINDKPGDDAEAAPSTEAQESE